MIIQILSPYLQFDNCGGEIPKDDGLSVLLHTRTIEGAEQNFSESSATAAAEEIFQTTAASVYDSGIVIDVQKLSPIKDIGDDELKRAFLRHSVKLMLVRKLYYCIHCLLYNFYTLVYYKFKKLKFYS